MSYSQIWDIELSPESLTTSTIKLPVTEDGYPVAPVTLEFFAYRPFAKSFTEVLFGIIPINLFTPRNLILGGVDGPYLNNLTSINDLSFNKNYTCTIPSASVPSDSPITGSSLIIHNFFAAGNLSFMIMVNSGGDIKKIRTHTSAGWQNFYDL